MTATGIVRRHAAGVQKALGKRGPARDARVMRAGRQRHTVRDRAAAVAVAHGGGYLARMARTAVQFVCRTCGAVHPKWMGKCPDCGEWDALEELRVSAAAADPHRGTIDPIENPRPVSLRGVDATAASAGVRRIATGIGELDRVLGGAPGSLTDNGPDARGERSNRGASSGSPANGSRHTRGDAARPDAGFVPGSAVLIGGDPGIGKSTLLLQAAHRLAAAGRRVLYVTSEESVDQLRLRSRRLTDAEGRDDEKQDAGSSDAEPSDDDLLVLADTNLARILEQARRVEPAVMIVDSVQMIYKADLPAAPGSVSQLRACAQELVWLAKACGMAVVLVGHVTKQGQLAGPRLLEHMVDAVLYFEGDRYHHHRVIRAIKNRYGTTMEVGLFEMTDAGLREVADGRGLVAAEHDPRPGSVICPVLQGTRCLLVEVQALTSTGFLGAVKRKVSGLDGNRLALVIAVLEKRAGLRLADQDVFASSVGGMRIVEPAVDLALALAIAGAHLNRSLPERCCVAGEVGLGGEVRAVQQIEHRCREASRMGFTRIVTPVGGGAAGASGGAERMAVRHLADAMELLS